MYQCRYFNVFPNINQVLVGFTHSQFSEASPNSHLFCLGRAGVLGGQGGQEGQDAQGDPKINKYFKVQ